MSHWNYRVWRTTDRGDEVFEIVSVYYDDAGEPNGWGERQTVPFGFTVEELRADLRRMLEACDKPLFEPR